MDSGVSSHAKDWFRNEFGRLPGVDLMVGVRIQATAAQLVWCCKARTPVCLFALNFQQSCFFVGFSVGSARAVPVDSGTGCRNSHDGFGKF